MAASTSPIREIARTARAAQKFWIRTDFELTPRRRLKTFVSTYSINGKRHWTASMDEHTQRTSVQKLVDAIDIVDAMRQVASSYPKATVLPETIELTIEKGPTTASKLKPVVIQAWHELLGQPIPTSAELADAVKTRNSARKAAADRLVELLKSGQPGVKELKRRPAVDRLAIDLREADLAGARLDGAEFGGANLEGADLSGASLEKAEFWGCPHPSRLKGARLVGAKLSGASITRCQGADTDFSGADLRAAVLTYGSFLRAKFVGADLSKATLNGSDLRGADFTDARFDDVELERGTFDEATRWPAGYLPPLEVKWKGEGPDPRSGPSAEERALPPPADSAGLLERLKGATERAKLDKALAMLKADRFQLFANVAGDHLVGVVKSQSDATLVYACRLADNGQYACCTQNLNACGGLRGSPCKHLLVLILGLAQAGHLDAGTVHGWTLASRGRKPELDKDAMAEVFLRYKGAETGEIDWRPTETIPEDFYAM